MPHKHINKILHKITHTHAHSKHAASSVGNSIQKRISFIAVMTDGLAGKNSSYFVKDSFGLNVLKMCSFLNDNYLVQF